MVGKVLGQNGEAALETKPFKVADPGAKAVISKFDPESILQQELRSVLEEFLTGQLNFGNFNR
jgi:hypothetical protein